MADEKKDVCPKCGAPLGEIVTTATGRKLQRCTKGSWDPETKQNIGCDYVYWHVMDSQQLDEKCPKCGAPLVLAFTKFGKKMKKCSTGGWDKETKQATGCDYVEWLNGTTQPLDEDCPVCGAKLVLFTTNSGKRMKKCSTAGWDRAAKKATGCTYVYWLKPGEYKQEDTGEQFLPPEPPGEDMPF